MNESTQTSNCVYGSELLGICLNGAEPRIDPPLSDSLPSLLCPSACSPFCELFLGQVPDQTPIALCEREFICEAGFQKYADTVMTG
jgi:hypothetical protein